jgi:hypothetical protein
VDGLLESSGIRVETLNSFFCSTTAELGRIAEKQVLDVALRTVTPQSGCLFVACSQYSLHHAGTKKPSGQADKARSKMSAIGTKLPRQPTRRIEGKADIGPEQRLRPVVCYFALAAQSQPVMI